MDRSDKVKMSDISRSIDEVIKLGVTPLLNAFEFNKSGRTFHRSFSEIWQVVNVQASQGNIGANGKFTINLGIYHPGIAALAGRSLGAEKPKEYECIVRKRIGDLLPNKTDYWWEITPSTKAEELAKEVGAAVEKLGLPWLEKCSDIRKIAYILSEKPSILSAAAALFLGDKQEARRRVLRMMAERPMTTDAARSWAEKYGLEDVN